MAYLRENGGLTAARDSYNYSAVTVCEYRGLLSGGFISHFRAELATLGTTWLLLCWVLYTNLHEGKKWHRKY